MKIAVSTDERTHLVDVILEYLQKRGHDAQYFGPEPDRPADWPGVTLEAVERVVRPGVEVVPTVLRPRPASDVRGRAVAYFSTAPTSAHPLLESHLRTEHGADVVYVSGNLADREALRAELEHVEADVYVVELKAAAIDVVAEHAVGRGAEIVLAANDVTPVAEAHKLDEMLLEMAGITV